MASFPVSWLAPPQTVKLESNEVHVWRALRERVASSLQRLEKTLSSEERQRSARFYFRKDREEFIVARGLLRIVLGRLEFIYGPRGKPALADESDEHILRFNLSHSDGLVLLAAAFGRQIGIDVERVHADFEIEPIAEHFFAPGEKTRLRSLPAEQQLESFSVCWTRKEAYIKARGDGLAQRLDRFEVSLEPGKPARLLFALDDPEGASRWLLRDLPPTPGYTAAVAAEGLDWRLQCYQWSE